MTPSASSLARALDLVPPSQGANCTWLGQSGFLIRFPATTIVIDPFLSDHPDRLVPPMAQPGDFARVDLVIGTHDHLDHIDRPAWAEIARHFKACRFAVPTLVLETVSRESGIPSHRFFGLDESHTLALQDVRITGIAAAHEFLHRDAQTGRFPYLGVIMEGPGATVYHAGDTCLYPGLSERLLSWAEIDLAILPINGRDADRWRRGIRGNMTWQEAADLAGYIRPELTVPCHWDMFALNGGDPEAFADYMSVKYPDLSVRIPEHGDTFTAG